MDNLRHTHPLSIIGYIYRYLFLLLFPLLRGFFVALQGDLIDWLSGAWFDLATLGVILWLAWLRWRNFKYQMSINIFYYTTGILYSREITIPMEKICTFSLRQPFWLKPFSLSKVQLDTLAHRPDKPDLTFYVHTHEAERLLALRETASHIHHSFPDKKAPRVFQPSLWGVLFLCVFTSNSLFGILFLSAFISQAGKLLGRQLSSLFVEGLESTAKGLSELLPSLTSNLTAGMIALQIPPVAAGVALILLLGWLVAFLRNLLHSKNLEVERSGSLLWVRCGVIEKKTDCINTSDICYVDIRQSLFTKLFRLYSVFIDAIGYGKDRFGVTAVIPFERWPATRFRLEFLLPEYKPSPRTLKPNPSAIFKFILEPLGACGAVPIAAFLGCWLLPSWSPLIRFAGWMGMLPALWFLGVRLIDFRTSGLSRQGNLFTLRYSNKYYLHTVVISKTQISRLDLRQSILQRPSGKCDVLIYSRAEGIRRHHLRNLDLKDCISLFEIQDSWTPADAGLPNWYERLWEKLLLCLKRHWKKG